MAGKGDVDVEENLYGCYLLCCLNKKFLGHTYIGYTVNPARRIAQHNRGVKAGGAKRTSNRGPWDMVLMVHGFLNCNAALKFEWAWQHPNRSRRLRHVEGRQRKETPLQFRYRVCCEMLLVGPWTRLPLTLRWLKREYYMEFDARLRPPPHMPVVFGAVLSQKVGAVGQPSGSNHNDNAGVEVKLTERAGVPPDRCFVCESEIEPSSRLECLNVECSMRSHVTCLALVFADEEDHLLPVEGRCPVCATPLLWGDLIRAKNGCFRNQLLSQNDSDGSFSDDHWANELQLSSSQSQSPDK